MHMQIILQYFTGDVYLLLLSIFSCMHTQSTLLLYNELTKQRRYYDIQNEKSTIAQNMYLSAFNQSISHLNWLKSYF